MGEDVLLRDILMKNGKFYKSYAKAIERQLK